MKFEQPIEVSGITTIVIDRTMVWQRWSRIVKEDQDWHLTKPERKTKPWDVKTSSAMKKYLTALLNTHRVWIHEDTLNLVKK